MASVRSFPTFSSYLRLVLIIAAAIILPKSFVNADLTRQECLDLGGLIVGDIGDGSSQQPGYLCASNGQPIIDIVVPLPGEPIADEGEVCCGQDNGTLTRQGCTDLGGLIVNDIGDGSSRQPGYLCESNGQPIIGIVVPLPGEPIAREGEVCCGQDSGTLTRQECTDLGGLIVADIGDGSSRQPDYRCASDGQPIIGIVVPLPGEPLSDEGEVCCGQDSGTLTRQGCTDLGGLVVGDIGDGSSRQPDYRCASNGQPIIGIVEPLPGEPIAVEGEVCCGQDSGTLTRQGCTDLGGLVVGDIGDGSSRQPDYLCASNGQPIIGIVVPLPGEPIAVEGEVCCGQDSGTLTRQECTDLGGLIVADIGDGSSREPDYLCASNGQPIIGIVMPLPGEPISDEGEVCCGQDSGTLTRQECTDLGGLIVGDIGDGSSRQPGYLCASNGQPIIGIVVPLPGEPIADEGEVCCGQDSGPGPAGCPATIPENVGEGFPVMHYQHQHIRRKGYGKMKSCPCRLESIVALGDSFSDVGNAFLSDVCDPPTTGVFCNQRNSNGALVVEYLAASLNVGPMSIAFALGGNNFAVAGASSSPADTNSIVTQAFFYGIATGLLPDDPENPSPIPPGYLEPSNSKRLHTITAGGNEVVDAVISDIATFLGYENVQETSLTPEGFVRAGADGLGVILSTLLSLPGVCNVLLYTTSDVGTTPLTLALDKFYASQGHPGVSKRATEYSLLSVKLFEREVANVQDAFDSKCHAAGAEFGIHLINSLELAKRVDGRLFPKTKTSCNHHYTVSQAVCEATAAPALLEVPYIPMSEDGSLVWCRFNAAPPVNCDCKGYKLFDEFHPTTAFNREFSDLSLHILNNICHDLY